MKLSLDQVFLQEKNLAPSIALSTAAGVLTGGLGGAFFSFSAPALGALVGISTITTVTSSIANRLLYSQPRWIKISVYIGVIAAIAFSGTYLMGSLFAFSFVSYKVALCVGSAAFTVNLFFAYVMKQWQLRVVQDPVSLPKKRMQVTPRQDLEVKAKKIPKKEEDLSTAFSYKSTMSKVAVVSLGILALGAVFYLWYNKGRLENADLLPKDRNLPAQTNIASDPLSEGFQLDKKVSAETNIVLGTLSEGSQSDRNLSAQTNVARDALFFGSRFREKQGFPLNHSLDFCPLNPDENRNNLLEFKKKKTPLQEITSNGGLKINPNTELENIGKRTIPSIHQNSNKEDHWFSNTVAEITQLVKKCEKVLQIYTDFSVFSLLEKADENRSSVLAGSISLLAIYPLMQVGGSILREACVSMQGFVDFFKIRRIQAEIYREEEELTDNEVIVNSLGRLKKYSGVFASLLDPTNDNSNKSSNEPSYRATEPRLIVPTVARFYFKGACFQKRQIFNEKTGVAEHPNRPLVVLRTPTDLTLLRGLLVEYNAKAVIDLGKESDIRDAVTLKGTPVSEKSNIIEEGKDSQSGIISDNSDFITPLKNRDGTYNISYNERNTTTTILRPEKWDPSIENLEELVNLLCTYAPDLEKNIFILYREESEWTLSLMLAFALRFNELMRCKKYFPEFNSDNFEDIIRAILIDIAINTGSTVLFELENYKIIYKYVVHFFSKKKLAEISLNTKPRKEKLSSWERIRWFSKLLIGANPQADITSKEILAFKTSCCPPQAGLIEGLSTQKNGENAFLNATNVSHNHNDLRPIVLAEHLLIDPEQYLQIIGQKMGSEGAEGVVIYVKDSEARPDDLLEEIKKGQEKRYHITGYLKNINYSTGRFDAYSWEDVGSRWIAVTWVEETGKMKRYKLKNSLGVSTEFKRYTYAWPEKGGAGTFSLRDLVDKIEASCPEGKILWIHGTEGGTLGTDCKINTDYSGALAAALRLKQGINKREITKDNLEEALVFIILILRIQRDMAIVKNEEDYNMLYDYGLDLLNG